MQKSPPNLRVAAAQMKFASSIDGNLAKIEAFAKRAARRQADVILFPEAATTGYAYDFSNLKRAEIRAALNHISGLPRLHSLSQFLS